MGVYKNVWKMSIHIPFGDIDGGFLKKEVGAIVIDFYGDGQLIEVYSGFSEQTVEEIISDYDEYRMNNGNFE